MRNLSKYLAVCGVFLTCFGVVGLQYRPFQASGIICLGCALIYRAYREKKEIRAKEEGYELMKGGIADTSEAPRGRDIYYRCAECGDVLPSDPKDNVGCLCGNIFTDFDYFRLAVRDLPKFEVLKKGQSAAITRPREVESKPSWQKPL